MLGIYVYVHYIISVSTVCLRIFHGVISGLTNVNEKNMNVLEKLDVLDIVMSSTRCEVPECGFTSKAPYYPSFLHLAKK